MKVVRAVVLFFLSILLLQTKAQQKITFYEHIRPIILTRCAPCHHPGTVAPFSLLTYDDVAKRGRMIEHVTSTRFMPPWKADPVYQSFANEKILTQEEIELIHQWVVDDMPKGREAKGQRSHYVSPVALQNPDVVLTPQKPYVIHGDRKENFVLFVIPFEFEEEFNVRAIEYVSTNLKSIHHANFGIYAVDSSIDIYQDTDPVNADDLPIHANRQSELTRNLIYYNGWVPGASPITFPQGIGFKMPKRGVIILTNHYAPSTIEVVESSSLKMYFSKVEVARSVKTLSVGSGGIGEINPPLILLPNEVNTYRIQMEIVEPLSILYVWPHMHLLGKKFTAYYATMEGDTIPLVRVNSWDFNWQEAYQFKRLMKLPKGAVLTIEGVYDNTANNPNNPYSPPQIILSDGLMGTKNEMLSLILVYLPYREGDELVPLEFQR